MAEGPILVAGKSGQLARCLRDSAVLSDVPMVAVGRPELDLENGEGIDRVLAGSNRRQSSMRRPIQRSIGLKRNQNARLPLIAEEQRGLPMRQHGVASPSSTSRPTSFSTATNGRRIAKTTFRLR